MPKKPDYSRIAFGPGGQILEVPENEELLGQIRTTPVLPPTDLLKLAAFYRGYLTNQPLAFHLALLALTKQVSDPRLLEVLTTANGPIGKTTAEVAIGKTATEVATSVSNFWDWEDVGDFGSDEFREPGAPVTRIEIRWVLFSGVGLLIETSNLTGAQIAHYVIGVSPSPDSL